MLRLLCVGTVLIISQNLIATPGFTFNEKSCPSYDYRSHFGPVRNQDGTELCGVFAGTALLEEQFCLENKKNCGKSLSVIDGMRCQYARQNEGAKRRPGGEKFAGIPYGGLYDDKETIDCGMREGICFEDDAPFYQSRNLDCPQLIEGLKQAGQLDKLKHFSEACFYEQMGSCLYDDWKSKDKNQDTKAHDSGVKAARDRFQAAQGDYKLSGVDIVKILTQSNSKFEFLQLCSDRTRPKRRSVMVMLRFSTEKNLHLVFYSTCSFI